MGFIFKMKEYSEKVAIFVDGGYINKILKSYFNEAKINYLKLSDVICSNLNLSRLRTYFYHCMPIVRKGNKEDLIKQSNMQKFLTNI